MKKPLRYILVLSFLFVLTSSWAQKKESDTLKPRSIDVVKPYSPSISDAFKVKETPDLDAAEKQAKKKVLYRIYSIPVASTFTPRKGQAARIAQIKNSKQYQNYAMLGGGSYTSVVGDVYLNHAISRSQHVGGHLSHHSSQGGIKDVLLNDNFSSSKAQAHYNVQKRDVSWKLKGGLGRDVFNWYGLPKIYNSQPALTETIEGKHSYYNADIEGDISFDDNVVDTGNVLFRRFWDNQKSRENHAKLTTKMTFPIGHSKLLTSFELDYIKGRFERQYATETPLKYHNFLAGIGSQYVMEIDDLTLHLGASFFYLNNRITNKNKVYIYPKINADYIIVKDLLMAYGRIGGTLQQHTYYDFAKANPFVSPTLEVVPTDRQYHLTLGLKGKISSSMSYDVSVDYMSEKNKPLYRTQLPLASGALLSYQYGNSLGLVYDHVNTGSVRGVLSLDITQDFDVQLTGRYAIYDLSNEAEAWNLPHVEGTMLLDYTINKKWFLQGSLFYQGARKDLNPIPTTPQNAMRAINTLDGYWDANIHLGYNITDKIGAFVKANNLLNNTYRRWQNYPVQGFQILAGATFKFDF